jgi:hypothetical protein
MVCKAELVGLIVGGIGKSEIVGGNLVRRTRSDNQKSARFHLSVEARLQDPGAGYRPSNLPPCSVGACGDRYA